MEVQKIIQILAGTFEVQVNLSRLRFVFKITFSLNQVGNVYIYLFGILVYNNNID